jgi:hypothetical protein
MYVCMYAPISRCLWPSVTFRCINCHVDKLWNVNPLTCTSKWTPLVSVQYAVHLYYPETNIIISWTNFHRVNDRHNNRWCRSILTNDPQSPTCKAKGYSPIKGYTWLLLQRKVRYRVHNNPPLVPSLSQINPVHTPTTYWITIHFNIISSSPTHLKWTPCFSPNILNMFRPFHACYTHHLSYSHWVNRIIYSAWLVRITQLPNL